MALSLDRCTHWMLMACLFMSILVSFCREFPINTVKPCQSRILPVVVCCWFVVCFGCLRRKCRVTSKSSHTGGAQRQSSAICVLRSCFFQDQATRLIWETIGTDPEGGWFALLYIHAVDQWCPTLLTFDPFPSFLRGTNRIRFIYSTIESKARIGANLKSVHQTRMRYTLANLLPKERQTWTR